MQAEQSWARPRAGVARGRDWGHRTDDDPAHLAELPCRAGLQPLVDLVRGQVKEVQVIFHGVAVPQPVSQANDSYKHREAGVTEDEAVTAGLVASQGGTERGGKAQGPAAAAKARPRKQRGGGRGHTGCTF